MKLQDITGYTPITQKNIDNVKCTRIISGEGSDKYNKYIQYLAKKVLLISAKRIDGHANDEVAILARLDGTYESQPIYGYWDEKAETSIINITHNIEYNYMLDENKEQSLVFVHNHPNNSNTSINDILSALGNDAIAIVVAVGNNGCIHYISKEDTDSNYYRRLSSNIQKKINRKDITCEDSYNKLINKQNKFRIIIR